MIKEKIKKSEACLLVNDKRLLNIPPYITGVTISDTVESILPLAFSHHVTNFTVSPNNKNYSSSDDGRILFNKDKTVLITYPSATGNITIPDSVTSIGEDAFSRCSSLTSVTIGNNVTSIGYSAFDGCRSLTSVIIPDSVIEICEEVFYNCDSLTSVTIGAGVTKIGEKAFCVCNNLTNFTVSPNNKNYSSSDDGRILFNKDKTVLIAYPSATGDITIPDSVTSIGDYAFRGCNNLISVTIPDSVTSIGNAAFAFCKNLASITIPDGVISIGDQAFCGCKNLTNVTIPDSMTSIGNGAFMFCKNLASITIPDGVISIGDHAFDWYENLTYNEYKNGLYLGNSDNPYLALIRIKDKSITVFEINSKTKIISPEVFTACCNLTNFVLGPNNDFFSTSDDGKILFNKNKTVLIAYPSATGDIIIPDSVTEIDDFAFEGCSSLTSVTIPNSVITIGKSVFRNCSSLTSITIPDSVTSIGYEAFCGCCSLTTVNYKGAQEQWEQISIGYSNEDLTNATINYNYTGG